MPNAFDNPNWAGGMFAPVDPIGQPTGFGGALTSRGNSLIGMGMGLLQPHRPWAGESPWTNALQGWQTGSALDQRTAQQQQELRMQQERMRLAREQANREPEQIRLLRAAGIDPTSAEGREALFPKQNAPPSTVKAVNPNTGEEETYVWDPRERRFKPFQLGDGGAPQQGGGATTATTPVVPGTTLYWPQQQGADQNQTQTPTGQPRSPADLPPRVGPKAFEPEQQLRKEFQTNAKVYNEVRQSYQRVQSAKEDAAGDLALIFGYMKMLDPGSVVRETEFANAQNAAGVPDMIRNMYNRVLSGERLNPTQREQFKGQAGAIYDKYDQEYSALADQYRGIARQYRIDPSRVIPDYGPRPQLPPATQVVPSTSGAQAAPAKPPPQGGAAPQRPSTVPPGSAYSPSRQQWRDPSGKLYDASGKPL